MFQTGNTLASLRTKEQIGVRKAFDNRLAIELEMRRRKRQENELPAFQIQPNHLAFKSAYPLRQFIYETFAIVEPAHQYQNNWHIDCIAEMLEAATVGELKKILINIPRRCMKSTLVSIAWFCWSWSFLPQTKWLYASYAEKFAYRDSNLCRKIIESAYYQKRFGHVFSKSPITWKTSKFENTKGGSRECFGVTKGTGTGGDFLVVDDPHNIDEAESQKVIDKTIKWYFETFYNNVSDPKTAIRAIMHQRVGEDDLTGAILARELDYELLCLPMKFEDDHPHKNSVSKPLHLGTVSKFEQAKNMEVAAGTEKLWIDPRSPEAPTFDNTWFQKWYRDHFKALGLESSGEGALLWPNRFGEPEIKDQIAHLEAYGEAAQLQQRPIRRGGNFFNSKDFQQVPLGTIDLNNMVYIRYWDKAGTRGSGDWTVGTLIARTMKRPYDLYIIDIIRVQVGYYERMQLMKDTAAEDTKNYADSKDNTEYTVGIEQEMNSSGKDLTTIERDALLGYHVVIDKPRGKKAVRAKPVKSISEAGRIKVVKGMPWATAFFRELEKFDPDKDHQVDDQIDTLSGAVKYLIFGHTANRTPTSGAR